MTNDFGLREKLPYQVVKLSIGAHTVTVVLLSGRTPEAHALIRVAGYQSYLSLSL
jgi:hypothetical protein